MSKVSELEAGRRASADEVTRIKAAIRSPIGLKFGDVSSIAEAAATSNGVVHQWRRRHSNFPPPIVQLSTGPVWLMNEVWAWLDTPRANGRPASSKAQPTA